jgi:trehalose/maltose hydrolase-like predicted phosphorylase
MDVDRAGFEHVDKEGLLSFSPNIPKKWKQLSFTINFRERSLRVEISDKSVEVLLIRGEKLQVEINGKIAYCATSNHTIYENHK